MFPYYEGDWVSFLLQESYVFQFPWTLFPSLLLICFLLDTLYSIFLTFLLFRLPDEKSVAQRIIFLSSVPWLVNRGARPSVWPKPDGCRMFWKQMKLSHFLLLPLVLFPPVEVWYVFSYGSQKHHMFWFYCITLAGSWSNPWRRVLDLKSPGCQKILTAC